jgi:hypothetical protein
LSIAAVDGRGVWCGLRGWMLVCCVAVVGLADWVEFVDRCE